MDALLQIAPLGLGLGLGVLLRRTRLFSQADGEVSGAGYLPMACGDLSLGWERCSQRLTAACSLLRLQTAAKFVMWVTLPSLILQAFNGCAPAGVCWQAGAAAAAGPHHLPLPHSPIPSITLQLVTSRHSASGAARCTGGGPPDCGAQLLVRVDSSRPTDC